MTEKKRINVWHDVSPGNKSPKKVNVIIEIPKDSQLKYEFDKKTGLLKLDRYLYSAVHYCGDYGFIPQTLWKDNDPLDVLIISNRPVQSMTLCEVKILGVIKIKDEKEQDDKIIGVHTADPRYSQWDSLKEVPQHFIKEIKEFFKSYKKLQNKKVKVQDVYGVKEAYKTIKQSIDLYNKKYSKK